MHALARLDLIFLAQRGHLFPWSAVAFATGIGLYFALRFEPEFAHYLGATGLFLLAGTIALRQPGAVAVLAWGIGLCGVGFCVAGYRAHSVAAPVLEWRYHGPVTGRLVLVDRSASDAVRLTLDRVELARVPNWKTPSRVRVSVHGDPPDFPLMPGQHIMTTGHLSPPGGPVEPGGFDFRRHAWFLGLGAVGYTRNPVVLAAPAQSGAGLRLSQWRRSISDQIIALQGGDVGGFGAAVATGDRSGVSRVALDWLRAANTAHLLAISGLHMGLLAGFVFATLQHGLALFSWLALRISVRKLAACGALLVATGYLALSGGNVATERAYIMAAVMLVAVLLDRRAFSLRSVAIAALIVLALRPEALAGPGFQMSFAATTALVAVFGALRTQSWLSKGHRWQRVLAGVVLSSLIAGLATAPVGAAHFNAVSHYGLLANVLSVPVMGAVVVPSAVLAACLAPFGAEQVGLWVMGQGIGWILRVAEWVAGFETARSFVVSPGPWVLPLIALGALFVTLWQGRWRFLGLFPMTAALALWVDAHRPDLLIAEGGGLVGVMTDEGRALSKSRGAGFVARVWLENDGDPVAQSTAAARWTDNRSGIARAAIPGGQVVHVITKKAASTPILCGAGDLVISAHDVSAIGPCRAYTSLRSARLGSLAIVNGEIISAQDRSGARLWHGAHRSGQ